MHRHALTLFLAFSSLLAACRQSGNVVTPGDGSSSKGAFIVNEGGFSGGASLAYYDAEHDTLLRFVAAAESSWLFPTDMKIFGTKGYVAVSGSGRVEVIDPATRQAVKQIALGAGPGFLAPGGQAVYAANYDGTVSRIDTVVDSVTSTSAHIVSFPGGIAYAQGKVFVTDVGLYPSVGEWLKVLDATSLQTADSVRLGGSPSQMAFLNGRLYVVATAVSRVYAVNTATLRVEDSVQIAGFLSDIATDGRSLFVLGSDSVAKLSESPLGVENGGFIARSLGLYFYSLAADPATGDLYVGTVTGSAGTGVLEIYANTGVRKKSAQPVGTFPGAYAFR